MERKNYPLLYYKLTDKSVLGVLVGTNYQVVDKDLKGIKNTIAAHLQKQYKKHDEYPYMGIIDPKIKVIPVEIQPTYKEEDGSYPANETVKVPVVAVYGENASGYFECHLPLFNGSFYYYDEAQFKSLVTHFSTNFLNNFTPDALYRYMLYSPPKLDAVTLKIKEEREYNWDKDYVRTYPTLMKLADRYPHSKAIRRNMSAFPDAAWELEQKVEDVIDKLIGTRSNLLIVGNHGVGKSSVLKQAIRKITIKGKKEKLEFTFWQMTPHRMTASAKYLGEWQETCEAMIEDLQAANGILWMVDFIRLLQIGGEGPEDSVAAFLASFIQQGKLQLVGELTPTELESIRRLLPGFVEHFQIIKINELPERKIQNILTKFSDYCALNLKIKIKKEALELAYRLLLRYYPYEQFPGKAVKFLGQCVNEALILRKASITKEEVISNFIKQTGMPKLFLRDDLLLDRSDLESHFSNKIIGQPLAIKQMCGVVKIFKAGLNNPYKPITTMLFAGPTGVGKTASAKALANYFFGKGQKRSPLIRIDMSEFQHPGMIARFIGAGNEVGKLVQEIRERPFSVLLLDEVEKAHPSVFDALLTVLDEGILVDAFGRTTNFRNTIIIMTSNLGASNRTTIGFGGEDSAKYESAITNFFRPEFVNRIDHVVVFNSLNQENVKQITTIELNALKKREGFTKRQLKPQFTDRLRNHLASTGFDEKYGARPLQRAIEDQVVSPTAKWLLENPKVKECKLYLDYENGLRISLKKGGL